MVGRELLRNPSLLIAEDPTQGLDIGSIEQVRTTILDYASKGGSVVLVSQDLSEVLALSDRIVVMYEGRIVGERKSGDLDIGGNWINDDWPFVRWRRKGGKSK